MIVVEGEVADDVTLLGDPDRIRHVILDGQPVDLAPAPPRRDPPGWRVSHYGSGILHWGDVQ